MRKTATTALVALLFGLFAAMPAKTHGGAALSAPMTAAASSTVTVKDFEFQPRQLRVGAGTTVTWTNEGGSSHTVTADDGSFESPTLAAGKTYARRFTKPGTYHYHCAFHGGAGGEGMSGTVVVTR